MQDPHVFHYALAKMLHGVHLVLKLLVLVSENGGAVMMGLKRFDCTVRSRIAEYFYYLPFLNLFV